MIPLTLSRLSTTGKLVKPDLYSLSRTRGPSISLLFTNIILDFGIMRFSTLRSSKLIIAAIRLRSRLLKIDLGVRCKTAMNSSVVFGVYLGAGAFLGRYGSSLGSSHLTNLRISLLNMI